MVGVIPQHLEDWRAHAVGVVPDLKLQSWSIKLTGATVRWQRVTESGGDSQLFPLHHRRDRATHGFHKWWMRAVGVDFRGTPHIATGKIPHNTKSQPSERIDALPLARTHEHGTARTRSTRILFQPTPDRAGFSGDVRTISFVGTTKWQRYSPGSDRTGAPGHKIIHWFRHQRYGDKYYVVHGVTARTTRRSGSANYVRNRVSSSARARPRRCSPMRRPSRGDTVVEVLASVKSIRHRIR